MHTTLISTIGKPFKGRYDPAKFNLNDQVFETDFFFIPLLKHYQPDEFYLLGTKDSIWEVVEESRSRETFTYKQVEIPFGVTPEEIWQIFEAIVTLPLKNTHLIIDITHGFRAIPFAVFLAALYFQAVREDVVIEEILYGNFEARDKETKIAPVVHLKSYLDMNEWIRAAQRFVHYGDGDLLAKKLEDRLTPTTDSQKLLTNFREFINNLQLNFVTQIYPSAARLKESFLPGVEKQMFKIPPYRLIHPLIQNRLNIFLQKEPECKRQWRIADWFYQNRQFSQTLIVLREMLITFMAELLKLRTFNQYDREKKVSYLHTYFVNFNSKENLSNYKLTALQIEEMQSKFREIRKILGADLFDLWRTLIGEIQEARNHVGHALMRGKKTEDYVNPEDEISNIQQWLAQSGDVFHRIEQLPDKQKSLLVKHFKQVLKISFGSKIRLYLIVNEGVHPILQDLRRQFGDDIRYEVVTSGNVTLQQEKEVAQKVKTIVEANRGAEFVIVPSGLPYLITVVYNTVLQITSKHPVYLQLDREKGYYVEKMLDPRKLML